MRKWTMDNGQWTILIAFFVFQFSIVNFQLSIPVAYAADSTPSADIKGKLDELKKEIASKAAKLKEQVDRKLKNKAYVGKIKTRSDTSITIAVRSGPKIISINQDTNFDSNVKGKQKFSAKTISEEDYVATLGDIDETGVMTAKKIILLSTSNSQPKTYLWGQIISVSDKLVILKSRDLKNVAVSMPPNNVKLNDFVILTGSLNEQSSSSGKNEIFEAGFVYVIPQGGIIKPKKIATPSVQIATPSAKKK